MKTIIVLSDTHNCLVLDEHLCEALNHCDLIIHLGDGARDVNLLKDKFGDKVKCIEGNCDSFTARDKEIFAIEEVNILITHGHKYRVKSGLLALELECRQHEVNCGLYGHTHIASIDDMSGLILINPGSYMTDKTYCFLTIRDKKILARIVGRK